MGSGTYKLLGAGALSAITSCLIFFGVLTFFSGDGIFEFYEFVLSIGAAGIAPYLVSRLLTIKVKFNFSISSEIPMASSFPFLKQFNLMRSPASIVDFNVLPTLF